MNNERLTVELSYRSTQYTSVLNSFLYSSILKVSPLDVSFFNSDCTSNCLTLFSSSNSIYPRMMCDRIIMTLCLRNYTVYPSNIRGIFKYYIVSSRSTAVRSRSSLRSRRIARRRGKSPLQLRLLAGLHEVRHPRGRRRGAASRRRRGRRGGGGCGADPRRSLELSVSEKTLG